MLPTLKKSNLAFNILDSYKINKDGSKGVADILFGNSSPTFGKDMICSIIDMIEDDVLIDLLLLTSPHSEDNFDLGLKRIKRFFSLLYERMEQAGSIIEQINMLSDGGKNVGGQSNNIFLEAINSIGQIGNYDIDSICVDEAFYIIYKKVFENKEQEKEMKKKNKNV